MRLGAIDRAQVRHGADRASVRGLADTVVDRDYGCEPPELRTGYVFHQVDHQALESAMARAIGLWRDYPRDFVAG